MRCVLRLHDHHSQHVMPRFFATLTREMRSIGFKRNDIIRTNAGSTVSPSCTKNFVPHTFAIHYDTRQTLPEQEWISLFPRSMKFPGFIAPSPSRIHHSLPSLHTTSHTRCSPATPFPLNPFRIRNLDMRWLLR